MGAAIRGTLRTSPQQCERMTQDALNLAAKGATFSANAKLIKVLDFTADTLDAADKTSTHRRALTEGLLALREAEDFSQFDSRLGKSSRISVEILGHQTPVLIDRHDKELTESEALSLYYSYASRQLAAAAAGSPQGSLALYQLGRLQPYLSDGAKQREELVSARTLAWQRAALDADPQNFRAANEMGVVLARSGQWEQAKQVLIQSAEIGERPETLANLSVVLDKLGDRSGARSMVVLAAEQRKKSRQHAGQRGEPQSLVRLVDRRQFSLRAAALEISSIPLEPAADIAGKKAPDNDSEQKTRWSLWRQQRNSSKSTRIETVNYRANVGQTIVPQNELNIAPIPVPQGSYAAPESSPPESADGGGFDERDLQQGGYLGPLRIPHVPEYRLRIDDTLGFVFRLNGKPSSTPYRLNVGDVIRITSLTADNLSLETLVQPDGTIVLPQIGSVTAAGKTIDVLRRELDVRFQEFYRDPSISIAPVTINKTLEELRNAIITRTGLFNGQQFVGKISPDGMIQLPALGSVPALGLSLDELRHEVELRYAEIASGLEVTPLLQQRAPHFVFVLGEVQTPGRFELTGPTTAIQAISLAGSWNKGGNLKEVIVIRRDENWCYMAARINVRPALYNKEDLEAEDIWLRDSDIVIVPKLPIQVWDDWIDLVFTRGIYGVVPFNGVSFSFFKELSSLGAIN